MGGGDGHGRGEMSVLSFTCLHNFKGRWEACDWAIRTRGSGRSHSVCSEADICIASHLLTWKSDNCYT